MHPVALNNVPVTIHLMFIHSPHFQSEGCYLWEELALSQRKERKGNIQWTSGECNYNYKQFLADTLATCFSCQEEVCATDRGEYG